VVRGEFTGYHFKSYVVDRERVFVGSLNLDPRSIEINSEMGVIFHDPDLAEAVVAVATADADPDNSWRVEIDDQDQLTWTSSAGTVHRQPARGEWQRLLNWFYGLLPLEDQL
jgi:putative cardiolipin synthase